jgi:DnaJ-class molecular chaperone
MANYYLTLGVPKGANEKDIKQAYRKLARKYHPDLNPGDAGAEKQFRSINEAYEVLSDPESRKKYDRYGDKWKQAGQYESRFGHGEGSPFRWRTGTGGFGDDLGPGSFGGLEDLLGHAGGFGGRRGRRAATATRLEAPVSVTLEEAFSGSKRMVTFSTGGRQRRIEVTIPPGVDTGSVVRVSPGDGVRLFINVTVEPHARIRRQGKDLNLEVEVPFLDAILGSETEVQTLNGRVKLKVPPESQNGQRIRLAGRGMPKTGSTGTSGDLYVILRPVLPKNLTDEEKDLLEKFRELHS